MISMRSSSSIVRRYFSSDLLSRSTPSAAGSLALENSWRDLLSNKTPNNSNNHEDEDIIKRLVSEAIRFRSGRAQHVPDALTHALRQHYSHLDQEGKLAFFTSLATNFGVDSQKTEEAVQSWLKAVRRHTNISNSDDANVEENFLANNNRSAEHLRKAAEFLSQASQPLYSRMWLPLSQQYDGIAFLTHMRADLLNCIAQHRPLLYTSALKGMAESLRRSLAEWFAVGLLQLERVTWEKSNAAMLEKIMKQEKVHKISSWQELKARLAPHNRRVFIWTHPSMPGKPLVALHVALQHNISSSMNEILSTTTTPSLTDMNATLNEASVTTNSGNNFSRDDGNHHVIDAASTSLLGCSPLSSPTAAAPPPPPTTAVFYSISSMQPGLAGVDLGNNLIKRAARELLAETPTLHTLATLSPIPGFAAWLDTLIEQRIRGENAASSQAMQKLHLLLPHEAAALGAASGEHRMWVTDKEQASLLRSAVRKGHWVSNPALVDALHAPLLRLAAWYLMKEKRRGQSFCPVANFHLRNGAKIHRLCFLADVSPAGLLRSHSIMVNYQYELDKVEDRNLKYVVDGHIDADNDVLSLLD